MDIKNELEKLFMSIDTAQLLKRVFLGGFDTWEDYEKYGDAFVRVKIPQSTALTVSQKSCHPSC
jgi:hypothetical protein